MNRRVWWVLRDYIGRTPGLWLLVLLAQTLQCITYWAAGLPRIPLLATVIASLAYRALAEKPNSVLQTLPLTDTDTAMIRWWGTFGLPVIVVGVGIALTTWLSAHKGWIFPSALWVGTCTAGSAAALACSSAMGRAFNRWRTTDASGYVAIVWVVLTIVAIIGVPMRELSAPILGLVLLGSLCLSAVACLPASSPVPSSQLSEPRSRFCLRATGWTLMALEVGRTTAIICVAAFIAATIIHYGIAPWTRAALNGLVIWLVVSTIAVATGLSMRRWVEAVYSLRILPITGHRLVFALYLAMILPGVLTCLALSTAQHFSPGWGLNIPVYMLVVFLPAPMTLIRRERPATQQVEWPTWAGVFCSMCCLPFTPTWFFVYLAALAALFPIVRGTRITRPPISLHPIFRSF